MISMSNANYNILLGIVNEVIGNGGPSGVFDTLQELNDRYPKGAKGVFLVTINGKWYYWDGSEWAVGGVYQATQLSDGSVTDVKLEIGLQEKINLIPELHEEVTNLDQRVSHIISNNGDGKKDTELIDARGGFSVLGGRLNNLGNRLLGSEQQITILGANSATKAEVNGLSTATNQQLTYLEQVKSNKNDVRNKSVPITLNDIDGAFLAYLQEGPGGSPVNLLTVPKPNSVTPNSTNFIISSTNLFNKNDVIPDTALDRTTGLPVPNTTVVTSNYIQVRPSTAYSTERNMTFVEYDSSLNIVKVSGSSGTAPQTFTTSANTMYIRIVVQYEILNTKQLNEGSVLQPYEDWFVPFISGVNVRYLSKYSVGTENYQNNSITTEKVSFVRKSTNLFNKDDVIEGTGLNPVTGEEQPNPSAVTSSYIPVFPSQSYTTERSATMVQYDHEYNIVKVSGATGEVNVTFTTEPNAYYIRIAVSNELVPSKQINLGNALYPYEPWYEYFDNSLIDPSIIQSKVTSTPKQLPIKFIGDYKPITVQACDGTGSDNLSENSVAQDTYNLYDALMSEYPSYITRTLLGYDSSGSLPIYKYEFKPSDFTQPSDYKIDRPKVILLSGTHGKKEGYGDYQTSIFSLYYFMKDICTQWKTNELLEQLRWQVHFIIIPVVNPWGVNNKQRVNYNGVDLNRNYDYKWVQGTAGDYYGGTGPFSEVESQYVRDVVLANTDALMFSDFHTRGGSVDASQINLMIVPKEAILYDASRYLIERTSRSYQKQFTALPNIDYFGFISTGESAYSTNWAEKVIGIPSVTVETAPSVTGNSGLTVNNLPMMKMAAEEIGNWVVYSLQQYYK